MCGDPYEQGYMLHEHGKVLLNVGLNLREPPQSSLLVCKLVIERGEPYVLSYVRTIASLLERSFVSEAKVVEASEQDFVRKLHQW